MCKIVLNSTSLPVLPSQAASSILKHASQSLLLLLSVLPLSSQSSLYLADGSLQKIHHLLVTLFPVLSLGLQLTSEPAALSLDCFTLIIDDGVKTVGCWLD